jgi:hypothetical protein
MRTRPTIRRDERGAVALMVALSITALLVAGGIVLDIGMARVDRNVNKATADNAVTAGLQAANGGTGDVYNSSAVCAALEFLKKHRNLAGLPSDVCGAVDATQTCTPGTPFGYHGTTTSSNRRYEVWIKMPYSVSDTTSGGAFADESLSTLASDPGETTQGGCDQIGVVIKQWTQPGLSKIISSNEIANRVRSVARVKVGNGDPAPALLLLERAGCGVLAVGSAGSSSRIKVYGNDSSPGTIHSDSSATDGSCGTGSNQQLFQGKQANGIVAYGAANGTSGLLTSVATQNGKAANLVLDGAANVYATTAASELTTGTQSSVSGRKLVTRKPVDKRYLAGVSTATRAAYPVWNTNHTTAPGFTRFGCPTAANMTTMSGMNATQAVYIDCPGSGITLNGTIGAGTVYFHGFIKGGVLSMPNATKVYVDNTNDSGSIDSGSAITLSNTQAFCVRATACLPGTPSVGQCSQSPTLNPNSKATLFVRRGTLSGSGTSSLLRLCNTTVVMQGGDIGAGTAGSPGACLPTTVAKEPTADPCPSSPAAGNGSVDTSGAVDWTPPNAYGDMAASGLSVTQQQALWDGGEDLALWTETYGTGSTYKMAGGGAMHVSGVFMVPNAYPFNLSGTGIQDLTNAQYIVRAFAVAGGAVLTMKVDPNNVVGLPSLYDFRMVR